MAQSIFQKIIDLMKAIWNEFGGNDGLSPGAMNGLSKRRARESPLPKDILGKKGEDLAVDYIQEKGYCVLVRNANLPSCEVDIIAYDPREKEHVLIEVKTRSYWGPYSPYRAVNRKRRRKLSRAAKEYKAVSPCLTIRIRFDIIVIIWPEQELPRITHYENAFKSQ